MFSTMNLVNLTAVPDGPDNTSICVKCNDSHSSDNYNSEESKMLTLFDSTLCYSNGMMLS